MTSGLFLSGDEDKQTLIDLLKDYDRANRSLTKSLAISNDKLSFITAEKSRYETIIFELQNENQLFKRELNDQKQLLVKYDSKRSQLNRTLTNLRKYA